MNIYCAFLTIFFVLKKKQRAIKMMPIWLHKIDFVKNNIIIVIAKAK